MENSPINQPQNDPWFALARAILFEMDPEKAHDLALTSLRNGAVSAFVRKRYLTSSIPTEILGRQFPNLVGLAAGLDKNGDYIDALGAIGFGHIEVGTVTPKAQSGNPKPRLFRLPNHKALINRLGFNNKGVSHLVENAANRRYKGILGINIGKNATTPLEDAHQDYLYCLKEVYPVADYVTVNISSPNTKGLRDLQHGERLNQLLEALKQQQDLLATEHQKYVPLVVKIAPDMSDEELDTFCTCVLSHEIDAVISGNTTQDRQAVNQHIYAREAGGLSGQPLLEKANNRLSALAGRLENNMTIFGVGGISHGKDAADKLSLGASITQLYTGFIYQGPALVQSCIEHTNRYLEQQGQ